MPDDRFIHRRLGHSDKVSQLSDFESRVWFQYILSADDFGVMRSGAATFQADNDALAEKPATAIGKAVSRLVGIDLLQTFDHQGRAYLYQWDWQDWQKVDYPRATLHPAPPADRLSEKTRELFVKHPGGWGRKVSRTLGNGSANVPRTDPQPFAERSGEITPKPVAVSLKPLAVSREPSAEDKDSLAVQAGEFVDWYRDAHQRFVGVAYMGNAQTDYQTAMELVALFSSDDLRDGGTYWFGQRDAFALNGTRTIKKFASRASDCVLQARRVAS